MPKKGFKQSKEHIEKRMVGAKKGWFKKGQHSSPETEFKKGNIGWKKGHPFYGDLSSPNYYKIKDKRITGENNHSWKGGISRINKTERQFIMCGTDYRLWRKQVFERDNYTCKKCNKIGGYIVAHHIKSWKKYPKLRMDIKNGITLCSKCHIDHHKNYEKNCTTKQSTT